jgi:ubiquinone/menaquinone biosynthesis C-methylase UbiE
MLYEIITQNFGINPSMETKILDFGCGLGEMVSFFYSKGFDAHGCDIFDKWKNNPTTIGKFSLISQNPYRLLYDDNIFNVVISTSVLEHAKNKDECFSEIFRVLKPGGVSIHLFPSKWYLPYEPHIRIPLVNFFWPNCPDWWIRTWVHIRAIFIPKLKPYRSKIIETYLEFNREGIDYLPNSSYRQKSLKIFGNFESLTDLYIEKANGKFAKTVRKYGFNKLGSWLTANFRMNFICQRKPTKYKSI